MKKILVPTDFSANSKAGVRFAVHWSARQKVELVFIHVLHILRLPQWTDSYFAKYAKEEEALCRAKLEKFIAAIYAYMKVRPGKHSLAVIRGISADTCILDHCRKKKDIDCICISTRGGGKFSRVLGTNTGNLITRSTVPVLAIPGNYKVSEVKNVLYATDLHHYAEELDKVVDFALPFKAIINVLHFKWPGEMVLDEKTIESAFKKKYRHGLNVHFENNDADHSLLEDIQNYVQQKRPSVLIMFTNRERTFFQKIFFCPKSEKMSFQLKTPLLVFTKT